jgi:hypothetical protein
MTSPSLLPDEKSKAASGTAYGIRMPEIAGPDEHAQQPCHNKGDQ